MLYEIWTTLLAMNQNDTYSSNYTRLSSEDKVAAGLLIVPLCSGPGALHTLFYCFNNNVSRLDTDVIIKRLWKP
jgi:hypothetical protein